MLQRYSQCEQRIHALLPPGSHRDKASHVKGAASFITRFLPFPYPRSLFLAPAHLAELRCARKACHAPPGVHSVLVKALECQHLDPGIQEPQARQPTRCAVGELAPISSEEKTGQGGWARVLLCSRTHPAGQAEA